MDFHAEAVIADEFMKFVMNGSLYLGSKPVMWSPVEKTALAEAEVEYRDHESPPIWVKFPVVAGTGRAGGRERRDLDDDALDDPVEPRRRLSSDRIGYGLYAVDAAAGGQLGEAGRPLLARRHARRRRDEGRARRGLRAASATRGRARRRRPAPPACAVLDPHWDYDVPMLAGDFVTDDAGTGFVHMAPSPRRRRLRALRQERPRRPDDPQRARGLVLRAARAVLRRPAGLRRQGQGGQGQRRGHRQAGRGRRAASPAAG